jgi:hypothetical protein
MQRTAQTTIAPRKNEKSFVKMHPPNIARSTFAAPHYRTQKPY